MSLPSRIGGIRDHTRKILSGSILVLGLAYRRFDEVDAGEGAASMAHYAIFSLFPLLLVLVAVGSFALDPDQVRAMILSLLKKGVPVSQRLIERNVRRVFELRGAVGTMGMIGLLWSATSFFTTLAYHIDRAWVESELRGYLRRRLQALVMVSILAGLLVLSLIATASLEILRHFSRSFWGGFSTVGDLLWPLLSGLLPSLLTFLMLLGLYRWVPNTGVRWSEAIIAGLVATAGMETTTRAFSWYVHSGMARYQLIYGSLGAVVALMLWIYLNSLITLFGAHLSAVIAQQTRKG